MSHLSSNPMLSTMKRQCEDVLACLTAGEAEADPRPWLEREHTPEEWSQVITCANTLLTAAGVR